MNNIQSIETIISFIASILTLISGALGIIIYWIKRKNENKSGCKVANDNRKPQVVKIEVEPIMIEEITLKIVKKMLVEFNLLQLRKKSDSNKAENMKLGKLPTKSMAEAYNINIYNLRDGFGLVDSSVY